MLIQEIDTATATMAQLQQLAAKLNIQVGFITDQGRLDRRATWQEAIERFVTTAPAHAPQQQGQIDLFSAFGRKIYDGLRQTIASALDDSLSPNQAAACATAVARLYCQQPLSQNEQRALDWFRVWLREQPTTESLRLEASLTQQAQQLLTAA
jgi:hypothetical protein